MIRQTSLRARLAATTLALTLAGPPALSQTDTETEAAEPVAETTATEAGAAADTAAEADVSTPIATVDGTAVTLGELIALRSDLPEQYQALPDEVLMQGLTEQIVDQQLLANAARAAGLDKTREVELSLLNQERAVLADVYFEREIEKRVTPEAMKSLYDETVSQAEAVEEVKAAHILVDSEEKAKDLKAQLDEGADFAKLAADHGTDGTASRGGDLGWFAKGDMVPAFGEAAFGMEPGTISGPVETQFGWHLIRLDEKRERPAPTFEELEQALAQQVAEQAREAILAELREAATVEMPEALPPAAVIRQDDLLTD